MTSVYIGFTNCFIRIKGMIIIFTRFSMEVHVVTHYVKFLWEIYLYLL